MEKQPKIKIIKNEDKIIGIEIMEQAILDVATAAKKLLASKMTKRAVLVLIKDSSPALTLQQIETVLDCAARLDKRYLK